MKGLTFFQGEMITKLGKYIDQTKKIFFSRTTGPISTKLGTKHSWVMRIQFVQMMGPTFLQGDIIMKQRKYIDKIRKIFFSRTTGPTATKLGTMPPLMKGIQVCSNEGSALVQGEIITKQRKCIDVFFKLFFSRITGPISTKLGTMPPWVKGIQVCSNEWSHLFLRGDNYKIAKNTLTKLKNLLLQNQTWHSPSLGDENSSSFK